MSLVLISLGAGRYAVLCIVAEGEAVSARRFYGSMICKMIQSKAVRSVED